MRLSGLLLLVFVLGGCRDRAEGLADGPLARPLVAQPERSGVAPLSSLAPEGLRVSIAPSFGDYAFVVDFVPQTRGCDLVIDPDRMDRSRPVCGLVEVHYSLIGQGEHPAAPRHYRFLVPEEELREVIGDFDALAARWRDPGLGLDGTGIGVERYRRGRLTSLASSGAEPGNPAAMLGRAVSRMLLAYGPASAVPRDIDFTVNAEAAAERPCWATDFAAPDPDGFGTGNDACAAAQAARTAPPAP